MTTKICSMRGRGGVSGEKDSWHIVLEIGEDISNTITSVQKDNYVLEIEDGTIPFIKDDGGRAKYYKGRAGDCVCRAIAIVTEIDYKEVYDMIREETGQNPGRGINMRQDRFRRLMHRLGFQQGVISGAHFCKGELPEDKKIICIDNHHAIAVVNGEVRDSFDSRYDKWKRLRTVTGLWIYQASK